MRSAALTFAIPAIASSVALGQVAPRQEAPATEPPEVPQQQAPPAQTPPRTPISERLLDRPHDFLSRRMEEYARRLDDFFSEPNRAYDSTGSTLQIRGHVTLVDRGPEERKIDVRANISLPNTEDRLKVIVQRGLEAATQTAAERDIRSAAEASQVPTPVPPDNNYYLGLKAFVAEALHATVSAESGVKLGQPVDPYVRLRVFRDFVFSHWAIRLSETPLWKRTEGSSAASEIAALRPLSEEWQLRLTSKATWRSTTTYFDLTQIVSLYYTPDKRTAFTFDLGAFAPSDRSVEQSAYSVTLRARRQIYGDWLYLEFTPQILYREASGFRPENSVMVQLETLFGDRYLRP
jgi:hypothetical protein